MNNSHVTMQIMRPSYSRVTLNDKWEFKPVGKMPWLQRKLWRFLLWTGALTNTIEDRVSYRRVTFSRSGIMQQIFERHQALFAINRQPIRLLIGPAEMDELHADPAFVDMMRFGGPVMNFEGPMGWNRKIYDMRVTVVPWMKGVLVLDREAA